MDVIPIVTASANQIELNLTNFLYIIMANQLCAIIATVAKSPASGFGDLAKNLNVNFCTCAKIAIDFEWEKSHMCKI